MMIPDGRRGQEQLTEKFFWGQHSGIGGGNELETNCSDITLRFLIEEVNKHKLKLAFNKDHIPDEPDLFQKSTSESFFDRMLGWVAGKYVRLIASINDVHETAIKRYKKVRHWNPDALQPFERDIRDNTSREN